MERIVLLSIFGALAYYFGPSRRSGYFHKKAGLLKLLILAAVLICSVPFPGPTFYSIIDVNPSATTPEIKKAIAAHLSTLKRKGFTENEGPLNMLNTIANTLTDKENRVRYDSYGDFSTIGVELSPDSAIFKMIALAALHSLLMFVLGYVVTFPKMFRHARSMIGMWCLVMFVIEMQTRLKGLKWFWLWELPFQGVQLCRHLFPVALTWSLMISDWMHDDSEEILRYQMRGLFQLQQALLSRTMALRQSVGLTPETVMPPTDITHDLQSRRKH